MNDYWQLVLGATGGLGLGLFFYGGLYYTVVHGLNSKHPALWFISSFLLRMSLILMGLYFINDSHWQRLIACLSGFVVTGLAFRVWKQVPPLKDPATVDSLADASEKFTVQPIQNAS